MDRHDIFKRIREKAPSFSGGPSGFSISRQVLIEAFALVAPLLLALVLIKIYKVTFLLWPITRTFEWTAPGAAQVLKSLLTSPLLLSALAFVFVLYCCRLIARRQYWDVLSLVAIAAPAVALLNAFRLWKGKQSIFDFSYLMEFLQRAEIELTRWSILLQSDILFIFFYFIIVCIIKAAQPQSSSNILPYTINGLLILLAGLELVNYAKTGITDSGILLIYLLQNFSNLVPAVRSELDLGMLLTATLPLTLLAITPLLKVLFKRENPQTRFILKGTPTLAALLLVVALSPLATSIKSTIASRKIYSQRSGKLSGVTFLALWKSAPPLHD
jgi:hypothetical protein